MPRTMLGKTIRVPTGTMVFPHIHLYFSLILKPFLRNLGETIPLSNKLFQLLWMSVLNMETQGFTRPGYLHG